MLEDPREKEAARNLAAFRAGLESLFKDRARFVERYVLALALERRQPRGGVPRRRAGGVPPARSPGGAPPRSTPSAPPIVDESDFAATPGEPSAGGVTREYMPPSAAIPQPRPQPTTAAPQPTPAPDGAPESEGHAGETPDAGVPHRIVRPRTVRPGLRPSAPAPESPTRPPSDGDEEG